MAQGSKSLLLTAGTGRVGVQLAGWRGKRGGGGGGGHFNSEHTSQSRRALIGHAHCGAASACHDESEGEKRGGGGGAHVPQERALLTE